MAIHGTTSSYGCFPVAATRPSLSRSSLTVASCFSLRGTQGGLAGLWGPLSVAKLITKEGGYQRMVQIDLVHKGKTILSVYSKWWSKLYSPDPAEDVCGEEPAILARNCITIFLSFSGFVSFHTRCFLFHTLSLSVSSVYAPVRQALFIWAYASYSIPLVKWLSIPSWWSGSGVHIVSSFHLVSGWSRLPNHSCDCAQSLSYLRSSKLKPLPNLRKMS